MAESLSNDLLQSVYNHSPCGLLTLSAKGNILYCNQTLKSWLGIDLTSTSNFNITDILSKGGRLYYQLFVEPILRLHGEVNEVSLEIETANIKFDCLFSAVPAPVNGGDTKLFNAIFYKVVDRKKYEAELLIKKTKADTEKQDSRDKLQTVAFAQSHLVRAPLANILGLISIMQTIEMNDDMQQVLVMLQASAQTLDTEICNVINTVSDSG